MTWQTTASHSTEGRNNNGQSKRMLTTLMQQHLIEMDVMQPTNASREIDALTVVNGNQCLTLGEAVEQEEPW